MPTTTSGSELRGRYREDQLGALGLVATANVGQFLQIGAVFPLPGLFDLLTQTWHVRPAA